MYPEKMRQSSLMTMMTLEVICQLYCMGTSCVTLDRSCNLSEPLPFLVPEIKTLSTSLSCCDIMYVQCFVNIFGLDLVCSFPLRSHVPPMFPDTPQPHVSFPCPLRTFPSLSIFPLKLSIYFSPYPQGGQSCIGVICPQISFPLVLPLV